mgnify:CR=1 FL=1
MTDNVSPVSAEEILNHEEALQLAYSRKRESNLARCYIDLATASSGAKVPGFLIDAAERAIHDAQNPKGMRTNGPCMAMIDASKLAILLRYAQGVAPQSTSPTKVMPMPVLDE